ncbi:MAG: CPBP family intramembrane glutamic endopeptidase [Facklamia hominis]|uniref:CPBP family intramembrane glutamic endopeptidase n=1 Tax=Facklamia hominis TaxID=178214 RepID=UPI000C7C9E6E|nr:type II CAAX endopeptidase family protein [Facklamia hominis]PKY93752.1 CPBP family intramembrane metalloprotease [Facklamia hominis]WPJ91610.1 type II CAAX endopeptidase family protein [Facklamia hominis]
MKKQALTLIISYLLLNMGIPVALSRLTWMNQGQRSLYLLVLCQLLTMIIAYLLYKDELKKQWLDLKGQNFRQLFPKQFLKLYFAMLVIRIISMQIIGLFVDPNLLGQNQEIINQIAQSTPYIMTFFMTVLFAPFVEELVFRQALIGSFQSKKWINIMTFVSVILFTLAHMMHWADFVIYLPMAAIIVYFYRHYQENVIASMAFHGLNNLIAALLLSFLP